MRTSLYILILLCSPNILFGQNSDSIYKNPEVAAQYFGGMDSILAYLDRNSVYPKISIKNCDEGTVIINCIVERNGRISVNHIVESISNELDAESRRLVENMPAWRPAIQKGQTVRSNVEISLEFNLASEKAKRKKLKK